MVKQFIIGMIYMYQRTLSPDHGVVPRAPYVGCKYYPSCSEYTVRSIESRGVLIGITLGVWRILRCNPFSHGGVDLPRAPQHSDMTPLKYERHLSK